MNAIMKVNNDTMSHLQIAELLGLQERPDSVKRTMDRLKERGLISITPLVEPIPGGGKPRTTYHVNERDSYVVVAQLSPEFTAKLVDYWMNTKNTFKIPQTLSEALLLAGQLAADNDKLTLELNTAIETKAHITKGREGTLFARAGGLTKENNKLKLQLGLSEDYKTTKGIKWLPKVFNFNTPGAWTVAGQQLKALSKVMGQKVIKVPHSEFGEVNSYHMSVINEFKIRLENDWHYCRFYRRK